MLKLQTTEIKSKALCLLTILQYQEEAVDTETTAEWGRKVALFDWYSIKNSLDIIYNIDEDLFFEISQSLNRLLNDTKLEWDDVKIEINKDFQRVEKALNLLDYA